jgi:hypothetical protein
MAYYVKVERPRERQEEINTYQEQTKPQPKEEPAFYIKE